MTPIKDYHKISRELEGIRKTPDAESSTEEPQTTTLISPDTIAIKRIIDFFRSRIEEIETLIGQPAYQDLMRTSEIFEKTRTEKNDYPNIVIGEIHELVTSQIRRVMELILLAENAQKIRDRVDSMIERARHLEEINSVLDRATQTDHLTKVFNKKGLELEGRHIFDHCKSHEVPLSCLFIDIDYFKSVNDTHDHDVGDAVLRRFSGIISSEFRKYDITFQENLFMENHGASMQTTPVIARDGGEEFVVLMPYTRLEEAAAAAERLRARVQNEKFTIIKTNGKTRTIPIDLTCTIGIAEMTQKTANVNALKTSADDAAKQGKKAHRNIVCTATPANGKTFNFEFPFINDPSRKKLPSMERRAEN